MAKKRSDPSAVVRIDPQALIWLAQRCDHWMAYVPAEGVRDLSSAATHLRLCAIKLGGELERALEPASVSD